MSNAIHNLFVLIILLFLVFTFLHMYRRSQARKRIFDRGERVDPEPIFKQLEEVNQESPEYTFTCTAVRSFAIRARNIVLIDGLTTYATPGAQGRNVQQDRWPFTIAYKYDAVWFRTQGDVFTEAFIGSQYAVFWADPIKIQRLLKQPSKAYGRS